MTNDRSSLEGKLHELEAEVIRSRASLTRISQVLLMHVDHFSERQYDLILVRYAQNLNEFSLVYHLPTK